MKLLYFAWIRERVGLAEEEREVPSDIATVADLVEWLKGQGPEYEHSLGETRMLRFAVDKVHAGADTHVGNAREVAFFPPMTGG